MRKLILTLTAAGAAIAFAAPASAQMQYQPYYPQQPGYGYNNGYGYNPMAQMRSLQMRVDALQHHIRRLDRADRISSRTAKHLKRETYGLEHQLRDSFAYGFNPHAARDIEMRLARLEQRVSYAMNQRFGRGWNNYREGGYRQGDRNYDYRGYNDDRDDDDDDHHRGGWGHDDRD